MNKKLFFPTLLATLFLVAGCQKAEFSPNPTLKIGDAPVITSPTEGSALVLTEADAGDAFEVTWTAAEYGFRAATTYAVEIDRVGNDFSKAVTLGTSTGLALNSTVGALNTALFAGVGLIGEQVSEVEMRLAATVHPDVPTVYSQVVKLLVTPYTIVVIPDTLYVPGSYQDWKLEELNLPIGVLFSLKKDKRYEGYLYFKDDNTEFKYAPERKWLLSYGDTGADGTLEDANGANIKVATAGVYRLNVNLNTKTHSNLRTDWGLIGDATPGGWGSDQNMTFDPVTNKWTITLDLVAGKIKFRANDDWAVNFGDDQANKTLEYGGADISIAAAGNYTIDLLLGGPIYTYNVQKN